MGTLKFENYSIFHHSLLHHDRLSDETLKPVPRLLKAGSFCRWFLKTIPHLQLIILKYLISSRAIPSPSPTYWAFRRPTAENYTRALMRLIKVGWGFEREGERDRGKARERERGGQQGWRETERKNHVLYSSSIISSQCGLRIQTVLRSPCNWVL